MASDDRPRIGISACLLGQPVRFDAGHKRDVFLVETFGQHVEWFPVCPEVEAGFGTPRQSMRLRLTSPQVRERGERFEPSRIALVLNSDGTDVTDRLASYARKKAEKLAAADLSGFVLKKDSPSCGMERVKVYLPSGVGERGGRGLFAEALMARLPDLPVEEEGRLGDPRLRENFVERVFAYQRLRRLFDARWTVGHVVQFHTAYKLTLMAHSPTAYRELGRLVASAKAHPRGAFAELYRSGFMRALATIATPKRHANVMQHMLGYFSDDIDAGSRAELLGLIEEHRRGQVPRIVPLTLIRHHVRARGIDYLTGQTYLDPHPRELALLNHV
ncbi:MAG: YbgA family protein [Vicinamibacterales bacterium]